MRCISYGGQPIVVVKKLWSQPIVAVKKLWRSASNGCRCFGTLREKVSGDEKRKRDSELHNSGWFADIIEESQVELDIKE